MGYIEEIDKAVLAHGVWKQRLKTAIETGGSEFTVQQVQVDNRCDFGRWLYSLPPDIQAAEQWKKTQRLHAEFHTEAAHILRLALAGQKEEGLGLLAQGGKYNSLSGQLGIALTQWKFHLEGSKK